MTRRQQPAALQQISLQKRQHTARLVEQALARITDAQADVPADLRQYPDATIVAVARQLEPASRLTARTLRSNQEAARLIAQARAQPAQDHFEAFNNWRPPKRASARQKSNRAATLKNWSRQQLAVEAVGITEVIAHLENRLYVIEMVHWTDGPWTDAQPYPMQPFTIGGMVQTRLGTFQRHAKRQLIECILDLEPYASELYARLVHWDERYMAQLSTHGEQRVRRHKSGK